MKSAWKPIRCSFSKMQMIKHKIKELSRNMSVRRAINSKEHLSAFNRINEQKRRVAYLKHRKEEMNNELKHLSSRIKKHEESRALSIAKEEAIERRKAEQDRQTELKAMKKENGSKVMNISSPIIDLSRKVYTNSQYSDLLFHRKIDGKSRRFVSCSNNILKMKSLIRDGRTKSASEIYIKTRESYIALPYEEKTDIYDELLDVHSRLSDKR